ncbi:hypothetical protein BDV96DRAFT_639769 [Lophiotrema nucula]|uniref:Uncharacterized protein n=1 Tax=Lophiotrema nucula TaxID=690887 RepID=A0A6A5ZUQ1_9PLEO|nr:hypothetical protein BDV96DRAFT_639769 [Lophiotrema nucula]
MHFQKVFTTIPVLLGLAAADCWSDSGVRADNTHVGLSNIDAIAAEMQGYFVDEQTKIGCIDDYASGNHFYITVKKSNGQGSIDASVISNGLKKEMGGCTRGGHSWDGDWEYNVDTLAGTCVDPNYINQHKGSIPNLPN